MEERKEFVITPRYKRKAVSLLRYTMEKAIEKNTRESYRLFFEEFLYDLSINQLCSILETAMNNLEEKEFQAVLEDIWLLNSDRTNM